MQNKRFLGLFATIIVIAAAIYFFGSKRSEAPTVAEGNTATTTSETAAPPPKSAKSSSSGSQSAVYPTMAKDGSYLVTYDNSGFHPKSLSIVRGKSVRFVNNSTKAMRIGSTDTTNPVPQALSQPKTVGKGGVYDYTFNDAGVYNYANMNNTTDKGTVEVK